MLRRAPTLAAAGLLALGCVGRGKAPAPVAGRSDAPQPPDGYHYEARRIAPRVHVLAQPRAFHLQPLGNVTVVEQTGGLVLVDAGGSRGSGERVVALVRAISAKPVTAVILTHWHGDHPLGAAAVRRAWPRAEIIATARTRDHLLGRLMRAYPRGADAVADSAANAALQAQITGTAARLRSAAHGPDLAPAERAGFVRAARELLQYAHDMDGATLVAPTRTFTDRLLLPDREAPVEARFLGRANTDGDAVVWLPRQRVLVTGDVVVAPFPFGFGSYPAEWLRVLERLRGFDFRYLVPGHGAVQTDRTYLDRMTALITAARAQVAAFVAAGAGLDEVRARVDLSAWADGDAWTRRWFARYWVEPFVERAYREATGAPMTPEE
jgi:glyoxylase-like metal-dependent hydrolase (beta-lactamase superfamily II)